MCVHMYVHTYILYVRRVKYPGQGHCGDSERHQAQPLDEDAEPEVELRY